MPIQKTTPNPIGTTLKTKAKTLIFASLIYAGFLMSAYANAAETVNVSFNESSAQQLTSGLIPVFNPEDPRSDNLVKYAQSNRAPAQTRANQGNGQRQRQRQRLPNNPATAKRPIGDAPLPPVVTTFPPVRNPGAAPPVRARRVQGSNYVALPIGVQQGQNGGVARQGPHQKLPASLGNTPESGQNANSSAQRQGATPGAAPPVPVRRAQGRNYASPIGVRQGQNRLAARQGPHQKLPASPDNTPASGQNANSSAQRQGAAPPVPARQAQGRNYASPIGVRQGQNRLAARQGPHQKLPAFPDNTPESGQNANSSAQRQAQAELAVRANALKGFVYDGGRTGPFISQDNPNSSKTIEPLRRSNINTNKSAKKVFDGPVVQPFRVADRTVVKQQVRGIDLKTVEKNWTDAAFSKLLGGGANAKAYQKAGEPGTVYKVVKLETWSNGSSNESTVTDQVGGQAILQFAKAAINSDGGVFTKTDSLFKVAAQQHPEVVAVKSKDSPNMPTQYFAVTKTENIASPVFGKDGKPMQKLDKDGQPQVVQATNAYDRLKLRREPNLSRKEELTINLVIRRLNNKGIVWTDHKLQNLDIVKDPKSPTGHRVVFFDFDGFRPVKGKDRKERREISRKLQKEFDTIPDLNTLPNYKGKFDMTAFGNGLHADSVIFTPQVNQGRTYYNSLNNLDGGALQTEAFNQTQNKNLTRTIKIERS